LIVDERSSTSASQLSTVLSSSRRTIGSLLA
jgi:hypothetical protein